jgi:uncharacterized damage-inducible protein DinB
VVEQHARTDAFRGARFHLADLTGVRFRDCDLRGASITSCAVDGLRVDGFDGAAGRVVVDGVDVSAYVAAELDRRHPERVQLRAVRTADDHRAMWTTVERLWAGTIARARSLPEAARHERVDGEWSVTETLRHLVFAIEVWIDRLATGGGAPHHPLALPPTDMSDDAPRLGLDLDARPSFDEVVALHAERTASVRGVLDGLIDERLTEVRTASAGPQGGEESHTVGECLLVVAHEHCAHHRFAERDLARLESG